MSRGSSTSTIELQPVALPAHPVATKGNAELLGPASARASNSSRDGERILGELGGSGPDPTPRAEVAQKWNESKSNIYKLFATFYCFFVTGANDAAYGVSLL